MAAAAVAVALVASTAALRADDAHAADASCAEAVLDDWTDGRIDGTYERNCYLEAIAMLPEDVRAYTSAADDIARALQSLGSNRTPSGPAGRTATGVDAPVAAESSRGLPAPVVVLASIAVAVLAAGTAGLAARRLRVRRGA